jgi:transposase
VRAGISKKVILFADEAGFSIHPKLGRVWCKRGTQPTVMTRSQHQKRLNVFGWVDPVSGKHGMMRSKRGNTIGFLSFLRNLLCRVAGIRIELWVDNARWHKGKRIQHFCHQHKRLTIEYLPKYHPELNYQERLWKTMRYEETTNTFYEEFDDLSASVFSRSRKWKPVKMQSLCNFI